MNVKWVPISLLKLSSKREVVLKELISELFSNEMTPLLVDENYLLIDNYEVYFNYLFHRVTMVPVIISKAIDNFYFEEVISNAA
jgi:hypothetical protein